MRVLEASVRTLRMQIRAQASIVRHLERHRPSPRSLARERRRLELYLLAFESGMRGPTG